MNRISILIIPCFVLSLAPLASTAADTSSNVPAVNSPKVEKPAINTICPVTGKPADPKITVIYEDRTYAFADEASRTKWNADRANSLYQKLGGKAAMNAAIDLFYVKVLADDRINGFFEDINMNKQRRKQNEFLSAAFGGPLPWTGKNLREAHENIPGLSEVHFNAVAEHLQKTLEELKIKKELIDQVMAIAASTKDQVLNHKPSVK
ncbi:MAG: Cyanoglobin like protein [Verrucomicrobiales bacterium]|nr:Cyanoglobin like protein [Verrucomicrobiales bacterium]